MIRPSKSRQVSYVMESALYNCISGSDIAGRSRISRKNVEINCEWFNQGRKMRVISWRT